MKRARGHRTGQPPRTGTAPALGAVAAAVLGWASLQPAQAGEECSTDKAAEIAVERYGGKALSVSPDGDYLVVRLRLSDGRVIDVAVDRWGC